jgi:type IV pilus assembly protein PilX
MVALIVLVAMTLAGLGLMRSVNTSTRIAGNLAFQQAATQSADIGIETAIDWLEANAGTTALHDHINASGTPPSGAYFATRQAEPAAGQSWERYWTETMVNTTRVNVLPADAAGNTVSYVIQRLCQSTGNPLSSIGCAVSPETASTDGGSKRAGSLAPLLPRQQYYRITVRVAGPRNTTSMVQAVVAM